MSHSRKTERMPGTPAPGRTTERMPGLRDTVQDPPRIHDTSGPDPQPAVGPRGTQVVAPAPKPAAGKPSDKSVAGEVRIGAMPAPRTEAQGKVDVSRVDPRRAPTQLSQRKLHARAAKQKGGSNLLAAGIAVVVALSIVVGILVYLLVKQRTGR